MQKTAKNFVELLRQGARMWVGMSTYSYVAELEHVAKVKHSNPHSGALPQQINKILSCFLHCLWASLGYLNQFLNDFIQSGCLVISQSLQFTTMTIITPPSLHQSHRPQLWSYRITI